MSAVKRSISGPSELFEKADARQKALEYTTFSQYIQYLIEKDTKDRPAHLREEPPEYKVSSTAAPSPVDAEADRIRKAHAKKSHAK